MQATSEEDRQNWMDAIQGVILALINTSSAFVHVYDKMLQSRYLFPDGWFAQKCCVHAPECIVSHVLRVNIACTYQGSILHESHILRFNIACVSYNKLQYCMRVPKFFVSHV